MVVIPFSASSFYFLLEELGAPADERAPEKDLKLGSSEEIRLIYANGTNGTNSLAFEAWN
jgi:hypothetical protein